MQFLNNLEDNSILVIPNNIKDKILDYINNNKLLLNVKFMTFSDIKEGILYDYDNKSIYYLMKEYNLSYETSKNYIDNTYYLDSNEYDNEKLNYLLDIKNYLVSNNLLIFNKLFTNLLKSKTKLYVYGYDYIDKFNNYLLELCKKYINIEVIDKDYKDYSHDIYEFNTIEDEVLFVAEEISKLISNNVSLEHIFITGINDEYDFTIKRVFNSYNIPYFIENTNNLYDTVICKYFFNNLDKGDILEDIKSKFDVANNKLYLDIYNKLISLINDYYWIDNLLEVKNIMIEEAKNIHLSSIHMEHEIIITDIYNNIFSDSDYVFLMNFNNTSFPKIKKDEDYISDNIKPSTLNTSKEENEFNKNALLKNIKNIKNLTITYKLSSYFNNYYPSYLVEEIGNVKNIKFSISNYSNDINKLLFSKRLDNLIKFNENDKSLPILNNTYKIDYKSYNNKFTGLNTNINIDNYSYSNISNYYKCPFHFYLSNILYLDKYEESIDSFIGSLFHYCLDKYFSDKTINIDKVYDNYVKDKLSDKLKNNRNLFFIDKVKSEMHTIIDIINNQYKNIDSNFISWHEKYIKVNTKDIGINAKVNTILKGFVDKCIVIDNNVFIIDYKTGTSDKIDRDLFNYGLNIQLPIYMYLLESTNSNLNIAGIYLQHILTGNNRKVVNKTSNELRISELKLDGLTLNDENILSKFDSSYEKSNVIKGLKKSKDNELTKSVTYSYDDKNNLKELVKDLIIKCINNVYDSKFDISPIKIVNKEDACRWCNFKDICYRKNSDYKIIELKGGENNE